MAPDLPDHLHRILELARWAPSGDNTQPWRFEILADEHVLVHGFDTRAHCVYDLDGHPSQVALGALLETLAIAASGEGRVAEIRRRPETPDDHLLFDVRLIPVAGLPADPLLGHIAQRTVQRRALSARPLPASAKETLERAAAEGWRIQWHEGWRQRLRLALFMFHNAGIRLLIPEAHPTHRDIIAWGARFSEDKVPDQALGADPLTLRLMHWALADWRRVEFLNTWLMGHLTPRLEMDLWPGLRCAAHFALIAPRAPSGVDDYVAAGRAVQRVWLTATSLGLQMQPEMTPLIFSRYVREGREFTRLPWGRRRARELAGRLDSLLGEDAAPRAVFMARIGYGRAATARSLRLPLPGLLDGRPR
jgi:nitroreductase